MNKICKAIALSLKEKKKIHNRGKIQKKADWEKWSLSKHK